MNAWILVVVMASGRTIGAPFPTQKECQVVLKEVKKKFKGYKAVTSADCVEGSIEQEKSEDKKDESFI